MAEKKRADLADAVNRPLQELTFTEIIGGPLRACVDAQQEASAVRPCPHEVMQCGADVADMQAAGGRGGEARDDHAARSRSHATLGQEHCIHVARG
jgi:hypothetical protein